MSVADQRQALLNLIQSKQQSQCETLLNDASAQARQIVKAAFKDSRAQVATAIAEERHLLDEERVRTKAQLLTEARRSQQKRMTHWLRLAKDDLRQHLIQRWRQPQTRQHWLQSLSRQALTRFSHDQWTIHHGDDWCTEDQHALLSSVAAGNANKKLNFVLDSASIVAGLMIEAEGVVIDASVDGLLADTPLIDAKLLAYRNE